MLDPMAGSGTTLVAAKLRGHEAVGYDRDPLAVLIARSWLTSAEPDDVVSKATEVLRKARARARSMKIADAYPRSADSETRAFVRYWFDTTNRVQLAALSESISRLHRTPLRNLMWCALSRLIITKRTGVSLAMDVSHSRPHRTYERAPIRAFDRFEHSVKRIVALAPFSGAGNKYPTGSMELADARKLPIGNCSVDVVVTSPPYLNAIDYIRGHKLSLVWMGYNLQKLRDVRTTNMGTERVARRQAGDVATERIVHMMCPADDLPERHAGMLRGYVRDMRAVLSEVKRVLRSGGRAVLVIGNCNVREIFVQNSTCIEAISAELGMGVESVRSRPLPESRRYLPPPESIGAGKALRKRIREEVILTLVKR